MNIYVGNLPYRMSEDELRQMFAQFGAVSKASIIMDKETGRSKGFGFVEMDSAEEGEKAIKEMDGSPSAGRNLKVNEARPREDAPRGGRPPSRGPRSW